MSNIGIGLTAFTGLLAVFGLVSYVGLTFFTNDHNHTYGEPRIAGLLWFFIWGGISLVIALGFFVE